VVEILTDVFTITFSAHPTAWAKLRKAVHRKTSVKMCCTRDAVAATVLSLFDTPKTKVRQSKIEAKTGVKGNLISAVMEQLCMKRQRIATGSLQVL
jgi:hypothetical protein